MLRDLPLLDPRSVYFHRTVSALVNRLMHLSSRIRGPSFQLDYPHVNLGGDSQNCLERSVIMCEHAWKAEEHHVRDAEAIVRRLTNQGQPRTLISVQVTPLRPKRREQDRLQAGVTHDIESETSGILFRRRDRPESQIHALVFLSFAQFSSS